MDHPAASDRIQDGIRHRLESNRVNSKSPTESEVVAVRRIAKFLPPIGVLLLVAGMLLPSFLLYYPERGARLGYEAQSLVDFGDSLEVELDAYLLLAVLGGGGLLASIAIIRKRLLGIATGFVLACGLVGLATFLGRVLLITIGPNKPPYPNGPYSVGYGYFLGLGGATILVVSSVVLWKTVRPD